MRVFPENAGLVSVKQDLPGPIGADLQADLARDAALPAWKGHRIKNRERKVLWVQERSHIFYRPDGKVDYVSGELYDITEQKSLEETLREQYHFLENLLNTIPNPIFYKDTQGRFILQNFIFNSETGPSRYSLFPNLGA
jgi:PAS domain-containing protein